MSHNNALYIHVPFCRRKCGYCSFVSEQGREADIPSYVEAVKQEINARAAGRKITSVYFGGGTPSLLSAEQVADILSAAKSKCEIEEGIEITIEANPGTVNKAYLCALKEQGVNRLSLGIQSFNDEDLALLGRIHNAKQGREAVKAARAAGFENISLDLIYGLPGRERKQWQDTLLRAIEQDVEHLSLYCLTLESDTPMQRLIEERCLPPIDTDLAADQYELAEDMLAEVGYRHYEISNWAHPGRECFHNLVYWRNLPYIGLGAAAHSCMEGHRLSNTASIDTYMAAYIDGKDAAGEMDEVISPELELAETVILGLRLCCGVDYASVAARFGVDIQTHFSKQIAELADCGLLEYDSSHIKLTRAGRLLANEVFWRFLPEAVETKMS